MPLKTKQEGSQPIVLPLTFPLRDTARLWVSVGYELAGGEKSVMYFPDS